MKLSIIIPAYNVEQYLERCITSCRNQDMEQSQYEMLIVDDGSGDGTYDVACQLAERYSNVHAFTQPNQGQSGARNNALDRAQGEYVWFVDADDYIKPNCLNELYETAKLHDLDALYFALQRHFEDQPAPSGDLLCRQSTLPTLEVINGVDAVVGGYYPCSACAAIYRLEKLNKEGLRFTPKIFRQDVEFTYRSIPTLDRIMFLPEAYYFYYTHAGSVTTSNERAVVVRRMTGDGFVARTCKQLAEKYKDNKALSKTYSNHYNGVMLGALLSLWSNRKVWKKNGINSEIVEKYKELGVYPVKGPYKNLKHRLMFTILLNHKEFLA